ncbi:SDR family oxidoreductase [Roseateles cellulosilyticus]|uniref:SDR family oxidoreductase n=1 Tax=Pelomonas cellulosilytica TaxID=2906762 RepID=A0ABS8Y1Z8_9BURK|nr:SDR family oxidoreductase [Pelomonas sp. P8]MCE4557086.1 SDR family oxidoreductase [Pelomonas sp. P8]
MKILMTGATGFIGSRLLRELLAAGHRVVCAGRRPPSLEHARCTWLKLDFATTSAAAWMAHLDGLDVVVNLVGLFREQGGASFKVLHTRAPRALFDASAMAGVQRVVQVSALGADPHAETEFLRSKYEADQHLLSLPLQACVAQPSLVFGADGASARRLLALAALPLVPLPAGGQQRVQPIHVDDAVAALRALVEAPAGQLPGRRLALVGPRPLMLQDYLLALRRGLGLSGSPWLPVPAWAVGLAARLGRWRRDSLLDRAAWTMLQQGSTADAAPLARLLGRLPRAATQFIAPDQRDAMRVVAQLGWLLPLLRLSLAAVWLAAAFVSLVVYPIGQSFALLERAGVPPEWQPGALRGAAGLDLLLGLLTLWPPSAPAARRWLWGSQALLIGLYSAVITVALPEFWAHPYGPIVKNLPVLVLLAALWTLEPRRAAR